MPCDGHYSRESNKALIFALQAEEGMGVDTANGFFGPETTSRCPTLSEGMRGNLIRILQSALYVNRFSCPITGVYDGNTASAVKRFQIFTCLPETGVANMPTIKALLSSCGDTSRPARACDCATQLTPAKAYALREAGYECVGRYLTGYVDAGAKARPKNLTPAEIEAILRAGLRFFPIYQDGGWSPEYFTRGSPQGEHDGRIAVETARSLGIPLGTVIYFAVDCDLYNFQVTELIRPYFDGVFSSVCRSGFGYLVGIYGARNICSRISSMGYAVSSFVSGMSTGFSGNLGYPLPENWAFDQFCEFEFGGSSDGNFALDKDAYSGRDAGVSQVFGASDRRIPGMKLETIVTMPEITQDIIPDHLRVTMSKEISSTLGITPDEIGTFYTVGASCDGKSWSPLGVQLGAFWKDLGVSFSLLPPEGGSSPLDIFRHLSIGGVGISSSKDFGNVVISINGEIRSKWSSIGVEIEQKIQKATEPVEKEIVKRDRFTIEGNPLRVIYETIAVCSSALAKTRQQVWDVTISGLQSFSSSVTSSLSAIGKELAQSLQTIMPQAIVGNAFLTTCTVILFIALLPVGA